MPRGWSLRSRCRTSGHWAWAGESCDKAYRVRRILLKIDSVPDGIRDKSLRFRKAFDLIPCKPGLQDSTLSCDGRKDFESLIDFGAGVFAGHDGANAGFPFGTVGKAIPVAITPASKRAREKSMVRRPSPMMIGVMGVSLLGVELPSNVEACAGELLLEVVGVVPKALDAAGFVFEDVEGGDAGGGD